MGGKAEPAASLQRRAAPAPPTRQFGHVNPFLGGLSAAFAGRLYDALMCPKTLIRFTAAEGAGDHREASARSVYFQRAYDWLDGVFGMTGTRSRSASIV